MLHSHGERIAEEEAKKKDIGALFLDMSPDMSSFL